MGRGRGRGDKPGGGGGGGGGGWMGSGDGGPVAARWLLRGYLKSEMTATTGEFFLSSSSLKYAI